MHESAVRHRIMSIEDFLAWEARQEVKYEFDGFEPVAMAGGSLDHARILRDLPIAIGGRLQGSRLEFLGSDMKLLSLNRSRYPDGQIVCGPRDGAANFMTSPVVVFEVLSPGDERRDRVEKSAENLRIESIQTYVILGSDRMQATVLTRDGEAWTEQELGSSAWLTLPAIKIEVPLADLYAGVAFP